MTPERLEARAAQSRILREAFRVAGLCHAVAAEYLQVGVSAVGDWTTPEHPATISAADLHRLAQRWPSFWRAYRDLEDAEAEPAEPGSLDPERLLRRETKAVGDLAEAIDEASAPGSPKGRAWTRAEAIRVEREAHRVEELAHALVGAAHRVAAGGGR